MFNPPITDGANLFIWIFVALISFAVALMVSDIFGESGKKNEKTKEERL